MYIYKCENVLRCESFLRCGIVLQCKYGWKGSECVNDVCDEQVPTPSTKIRKDRKVKVKNTTAQANYIMNLFGLSAWWDRVCRHEKKQELQTTQSNQKAKVDFLTNYSPLRVARQTLTEREKSINPTDVNLKGSTTPKRLREDDNISTGGSPRKMQRMSFNEKNKFFNGGDSTATCLTKHKTFSN